MKPLLHYRSADGAEHKCELSEARVADLADALPWRPFRWHHGQRHYSGTYWCATTEGHVVYESRLELARLILADFDPLTVGIAAQPFLIEAQAAAGTRRHVPDFLLVDAAGLATVVNVKPAGPHDGLVDPAVPGLHYSPAEMFEQGIARAGRLRIPARADLVYDFLPVVWRTIQHYGVEVHGLRYNGGALSAHRNRTSPYLGANAGKWPLRYDPDDVSRIFFQDPSDHIWHTLRWEHAQDVPAPFSSEALAYARQLAAQRDRFPDDRRALADLLDRWEVGLASNPRERRMALRLSQQRAARTEKPSETPGDDPGGMAKVLALVAGSAEPQTGVALDGDDDAEEELLAVAADERAEPDPDDAEFYADAMGTL